VPRRGYRFVGQVTAAAPGETSPDEEQADAISSLRHMPFVGREREWRHLSSRVAAAAEGHGSLILLLGEAGVGKTRLLHELAEQAARDGVRVIESRCREGDWLPPYAPIADAIEDYVRVSTPEAVRTLAETHGAALAIAAPALRRLTTQPSVTPGLDPDEERERIASAAVDLVRTAAQQQTFLLLLDDVQWSDQSTLIVLERLSRILPSARVCLVLALRYPDPESNRILAMIRQFSAGSLSGELPLEGLARDRVGELVASVVRRDLDEPFVTALHRETGGNALFLREVLSNLLEEGVLAPGSAKGLPLDRIDPPASVREVIQRRVARLSDDARRLLRIGCVPTTGFEFAMAASLAGLEERNALDALDELIAANLVRGGEPSERYELCHALVRRVIYTALSPPRRTRIHRRLAETQARANDPSLAGEIAEHYLRSAELPGAEAGLPYLLEAVRLAEQVGAFPQAAALLRAGRNLVAADSAERCRLDARLGLALAWAGDRDQAATVASEAAEGLAREDGPQVAAAYLADAADAIWWSMLDGQAWTLAERGLAYAGDRRDLVWARLMAHGLTGREADDPEHPGVPREGEERRELSRVIFEHPTCLELGHHDELWRYANLASRDEVLRRGAGLGHFLGFWAGELREALEGTRAAADAALREHRVVRAALLMSLVGRLESGLGELDASAATLARAQELVSEIGTAPMVQLWLGGARAELVVLRGTGFEELMPFYEAALRSNVRETRWAMPITGAGAAYAAAQIGRDEDALRWVRGVIGAIDTAPGNSANYPHTLHLAIGALWTLGRTESIEILERNLRAKVLAPDFRAPHCDARLSVARICALTGRYDEAVAAFAAARSVLDEQGAQGLRAITDHDEALMYVRRGARGDRGRVRPLLAAAMRQFEVIGMPGWIERAQRLSKSETG
jgi:hypothetical protein